MDKMVVSNNTTLEMFSDFQKQLNPILKSNNIIQDYSLLNGFIFFVHSKVAVSIKNTLDEPKKVSGPGDEVFEFTKSVEGTFSTVEVADNSTNIIDTNAVVNILDLLWERIHYPIFKWFQAWKSSIIPNEKPKNPKYVEFRQMNSKANKFFKTVHKFYYELIEDITRQYDFSAVVSNFILQGLNIEIPNTADKYKIKLSSDSKLTIMLLLSLHKCTFLLGSCHRYKILNEKISRNFVIDDFKKSIRYFDYAILILPSLGETFLQKSLIYIQTENFGLALYEITRSILARIPSSAGLANFNKLILDQNCTLRKKFDSFLIDTHKSETSGGKIVDREVIEYFFFTLFGVQIAPQCWLNNSCKDRLSVGIGLDHIKTVFFEKISNRYVKNIASINKLLITLVGGYDILFLQENNKWIDQNYRKCGIKELSKRQLDYVTFAFEIIAYIINNTVIPGWQLYKDDFEYLGMVRIVICWIKTNKAIIQYSHRDANFCFALASLLNSIINSKKIHLESVFEERPKRSYFFEEDIMLKEFLPVNKELSDFNDLDVFDDDHHHGRTVGKLKKGEKVSQDEENELRLCSILYSGKKYMSKNCCGVEWNELDRKFDLPAFAKQRKTVDKKNQFSNDVEKKIIKKILTHNAATTSLNDKKGNSYATIPKRNRNGKPRQNLEKESMRGYSGSSVPTAPTGFDFKPSDSLTFKASLENAEASDEISTNFQENIFSEVTVASNVSSKGEQINGMVKAEAIEIKELFSAQVETSKRSVEIMQPYADTNYSNGSQSYPLTTESPAMGSAQSFPQKQIYNNNSMPQPGYYYSQQYQMPVYPPGFFPPKMMGVPPNNNVPYYYGQYQYPHQQMAYSGAPQPQMFAPSGQSSVPPPQESPSFQHLQSFPQQMYQRQAEPSAYSQIYANGTVNDPNMSNQSLS